MSTVMPAPNRTTQSKKSQTSDGYDLPPHGLKGTLPIGGALTADAILTMAGVVLAVAVFTAFLVSLWLKLRSSPKINSDDGSLLATPGRWAELWNMISDIKIPSSNHAHTKAWNQFTSDVSLCLRRGIEIRTGSPVAERTTQEIERLLASGDLKLPAISEHDLRSILSRLDAVRFGGMPMSESEAETLLTALKHWTKILESDQKSENIRSSDHVLPVDGKGGIRVFDT